MIRHVPSKPGQPIATRDPDRRGIYMTVEWTEPENDGRAAITGYVIKYAGRRGLSIIKKDDEDLDVDEYDETDELSVDGNTTNFQFTHQLSGLTFYRFSVSAVNDAGRGEFSEFSDKVLTFYGKYC